MSVPDFGEKVETFVVEGYETTVTCRYIVPGYTFSDLMEIFYIAHDTGNQYSGNPSEWPDHAGVIAVVNTVLESVYNASNSCPSQPNTL